MYRQFCLLLFGVMLRGIFCFCISLTFHRRMGFFFFLGFHVFFPPFLSDPSSSLLSSREHKNKGAMVRCCMILALSFICGFQWIEYTAKEEKKGIMASWSFQTALICFVFFVCIRSPVWKFLLRPVLCVSLRSSGWQLSSHNTASSPASRWH